MLVCMKCHMEYEDGTPFCSNCGGDLVTKEAPKPIKEDKKKGEGSETGWETHLPQMSSSLREVDNLHQMRDTSCHAIRFERDERISTSSCA